MDPCIHGEDPLDQKNADGQTAFQLYIVDARFVDLNVCTYCDFLLPVSIINIGGQS